MTQLRRICLVYVVASLGWYETGLEQPIQLNMTIMPRTHEHSS